MGSRPSVIRPWTYWAVCLALSVACAAVVGLDVGWPLSGAVVAAFMLVAPASVVAGLGRFGDPLVTVVAAMVTGPALWSVIGSVAAITGWWHPRATVLVACGLLGVAGLVGLVSELRRARAGTRARPTPRRPR